ncbi:MAG: protein kinase [Anaerolineae bacterium]|nr:protein kinase [Anaerolineae bacterium]
MANLNPDDLNEFVKLLTPLCTTLRDRQTLFDLALGAGSGVTGDLTWDGNAREFLTHAARKLTLAQIIALLRAGRGLRNDPKLHERFDALITNLETRERYQQNPTGDSEDTPSVLDVPDKEPAAPELPGCRLVNLIGRGGMAEVWRAQQPLYDGRSREVAVKLLRAGSEARNKRFKRELAIIAELQHPNILEVYTSGQHESNLFIVMPLMSGGTLRDRLDQQHDPVPFTQALTWLEALAEALDYVHTKKIIHRDLKPANVLMYPDRTDGKALKLADFGIARSHFEASDQTDEGAILGSVHYMAPEQWGGEGLSICPQTDLYALGIIAYEMLCGHLPYQGTTPADFRDAHLSRELPPNSTHLSDPVLAVLRKATAKYPAERYSTGRAFIEALLSAETGAAPEAMDQVIENYLAYHIRSTEQLMRDEYITLEGRQQHQMPKLPPAPISPIEGLLPGRAQKRARILSAMEGDHCPPHDQTPQNVSDVCARLRDLAGSRSVLLGEPGTGKTWTLIRLFLQYTDEYRTLPPEKRQQARIPVFIPLRSFKGQTEHRTPQSFEAFVRLHLGVLAPYEARLRRENRLVFLCDALNEMPRKQDSRDLLGEVRTFLAGAPAWVVSCRVRDYDKSPDLDGLKPLDRLLVRELDLPQIKTLVLNRLGETEGAAVWTAMGGNPDLEQFWKYAVQQGKADSFWDANIVFTHKRSWDNDYRAWRKMHAGARLIPLGRNPFLLDKICELYEDKHVLPVGRGGLFEGFVDKLLAREAKLAEGRGESWAKGTEDRLKSALVRVAEGMQSARGTVLPQENARQRVDQPDADWLLDTAQAASILILEGESLRFSHQLLQEYFAVRLMLPLLEAWERGEVSATPAPFFDDHWWDAKAWRETVILLGETLNEGTRGPNRAARWLAQTSPEVALEVILRSAEGFSLTDVEPATRTALVEGALVRGDLAQAERTHPFGRAAAWRVLGKLRADPRPGVLDFNWGEDYWCPVPKGKFSYQGKPDKIDYDFWVAKFLITWAQWKLFLEAKDGYQNPAWWKDLHADGIKQQQGGAGEQRFKFDNHPAENVSWYDGMAFCCWLDVRWKAGEIKLPITVPSGYVLRMPLETEWEKAASWDAKSKKAREYPWDDGYKVGYANINEIANKVGSHYLRTTTAVGIYPQGVSPCGVLDMSGNVWEWCLNEYEGGQTNMGSNKTRGLRGGSWFAHFRARAAFRDQYDPLARNNYSGFRIVVAPVSLGSSSDH